MAAVMIGVDPHNASHTAVAISAAEEPLGGLRVRAYEVLCLADGQRMTVYQAEPGTRDHDALTLLSMIASGDEPENAAR
jgi:hypothetical protein